MRIVVALGGNALLKQDEAPSAQNQRRNARTAAQALAPIAQTHQIVITHGNGPQIGLLALHQASSAAGEAFPLDVLDAETEGQIGYLIEQEMRNALGPGRRCATLLTLIEVDPNDAAFEKPTKPIGPFCDEREAQKLVREHGWTFTQIDGRQRRVVPCPRPKRILEMDVIKMLVESSVVTICAGGGGIPIIVSEHDRLFGVEAVIDKDFASAHLATELNAETLLLLTDVDGVYTEWGRPRSRKVRRISPSDLRRFSLPAGSMGPKADSACDYVEATGGTAGIGALSDAAAILAGDAGTMITGSVTEIEYWD